MVDTVSTVFIVEDDPDMRKSLEYLLKTVGIASKAYATSNAFLASFQTDQPGCLVVDVRMPDISGLELFERLKSMGNRLPVILITAYADVPMAIRAFHSGAADFIEKPFNPQAMLETIQRALAAERDQRSSVATWEEFAHGMDDLTDKEREVLQMLLEGAAHKVIAVRLKISERAIELRRASVMKKLHVSSLAELIRRVTQFELLFPKRMARNRL